MTGKHKQRGFSLIEAAIVLAVVGLVLGGIWVAAAAMYENYKINKTVADLQLIVKNVQKLISFQDAESIGDGVNISSTLSSAGIFPDDWISGSFVKNPFGQWVSFYNRPKYFEIWFHDIPSAVCIKFIVKISSIAAIAERSGISIYARPSLGFMYFIYVNGAGNFGTGVFPVSLDTAKEACNQNLNTVAIYSGYTRIK
jgi:prepilin-type N-terminal cleavage/methylation domain-containing protein